MSVFSRSFTKWFDAEIAVPTLQECQPALYRVLEEAVGAGMTKREILRLASDTVSRTVAPASPERRGELTKGLIESTVNYLIANHRA